MQIFGLHITLNIFIGYKAKETGFHLTSQTEFCSLNVPKFTLMKFLMGIIPILRMQKLISFIRHSISCLTNRITTNLYTPTDSKLHDRSQS